MPQSPTHSPTTEWGIHLSLILMFGLLLAALRLLIFWTTLGGKRALMPLLPLLEPEIGWFPQATHLAQSALLVAGTLLWTTVVYFLLNVLSAALRRVCHVGGRP